MARAGRRAGSKDDSGTATDVRGVEIGKGANARKITQRRTPRKNGWTKARRAKFLQLLKESCNVTDSVRAVGLTLPAAYALRKRDPEFAAGWAEALEQGYAELEMHLLRQSIYGAKTTEIVDDGTENGSKKTKTVHSYPHIIALRLLLAHKDKVHAYRSEQGIERPGSEAIRTEIQQKLIAIRARTDDESTSDAASDDTEGDMDA
ncbi:MAG: hypothetical protein R3E11_02295 [Sphingobium sp.]|jgi:hypothetical protein|nr:hypothetical protein [Sphingobium sp.]MCP5398321.1 hypothetical protein [Sphingomonas sp.]